MPKQVELPVRLIFFYFFPYLYRLIVFFYLRFFLPIKFDLVRYKLAILKKYKFFFFNIKFIIKEEYKNYFYLSTTTFAGLFSRGSIPSSITTTSDIGINHFNSNVNLSLPDALYFAQEITSLKRNKCLNFL